MTGQYDRPFIHPRQRVDVFGAAISSKTYPNLRDACGDNVNPARILDICIITMDFVGPVKNGGIGTAYTYAAIALAQAGHKVTVLYSIKNCIDKTLDYWTEYYAEKGIKFVPITEPNVVLQKGPTSNGMLIPYRVYDWLKNRDSEFDFVHVSEWNAIGYLCLQAKDTGLHFQNTQFVVKCSSPTLWNRIGNAEPITAIRELSLMYMERRSVELADHVICGSQYLLNWMKDHGYSIPPDRTYVQPNIFPVSDVDRSGVDGRNIEVKELVFFGRLEPRKGLHIFVDALIQLKHGGFFDGRKEPKVTLLGKPRKGANVKQLVKKIEDSLSIEVNVLDNKNQPQALDYLSDRDGRVAVMPSLMDNSPFGVYECLSRGIAFISSNAGGGLELVKLDDHEAIMFDPVPGELARILKEILNKGCIVAEPSFHFSDNIRDWMDWHQAQAKPSFESDLVDATESELVSVCIAHHNRGVLLGNALDSVLAQTYRNIEVIIVDDGSTDTDALDMLDVIERTEYSLPVKVVRQANRYLGAVRNTGIDASKGKYILFMDDDNEAKPEEVMTFIKVARHTDADILTCWSDTFSGDRPHNSATKHHRIVFQGENLAMALIRNPYGDSNCFVKRSSVKSLNGFTEHYKVGLDDCEFFSRAILSGMKVMLVPESLYFYRINEVRMRQGQYNLFAGRERLVEPFTQGMHPDLSNIIRYALGMGYSFGPWGKPKKNKNRVKHNPKVNNYSLTEFGRRLVQRFPRLYPLAKYVHRKFY